MCSAQYNERFYQAPLIIFLKQLAVHNYDIRKKHTHLVEKTSKKFSDSGALWRLSLSSSTQAGLFYDQK